MRKVYRSNDLFDDWLLYYYGPVRINVLSSNLATVMSDARRAARGALSESSSSCLRSGGRVVGSDGEPSNISSGRCLFGAPLRLILEHHYTRTLTDTLVENFGPAAPLQHIAGICSCRIVLFTRLREPVTFYLSFYRWTVNWRQQLNSTHYGRDMFEWAPPNLQSSIFLNPVRRAVGRAPESVLGRTLQAQRQACTMLSSLVSIAQPTCPHPPASFPAADGFRFRRVRGPGDRSRPRQASRV
jgi:hypothetical protein